MVPLIVTPPHPSDAVGIVATITLHSPVRLGKFVTLGEGTPVSSIITFWVCMLVFPFPSS